ncbi:MAG: nitroreductase family protein [Candidatus Thorarchaeota archaeon]|nr:MAG: nitroreductase family protein [Candidatus Thorarchaeota archaeon]
MDVTKAIRDRRSIRKYKSTEVEFEKVDTILQAGRWAPSASNKQPWHFIVVRDEAMRKKFAKVHDYGRFMAESPVVIVVLGDPAKHPRYYLADPHNAVQNMLLAAHYEGLNTCWMGVRDTEIEPKFKELLGVPDDLRVICCISVGYGDQARTSTRFPIEDIVSWEKYGNKVG